MGSHITTASWSVINSLRALVHGLRISDRAAESGVGLSGAQLFVLSRLSVLGSGSVNDLAARTCTHQSSVSVIAQKLADRGLVARAPGDDGRTVVLSITSNGRRILSKSPGAAQEKLLKALGRMKPGRRRRLAGLLDEFVVAAGMSRARPDLFFEPADGAVRKMKRKVSVHAR